MPTSSVGPQNKNPERQRRAVRGVTLIEMLIVVTLIALVAGLSYPSIGAGLDSLRLRTASDAILTFLNSALDRAERRQQVVEIVVSPKENSLVARSDDNSFARRLDVPTPIHIASITPAVSENADEPRRFFIYPGGTVPRIGIRIENPEGAHRVVTVDPIVGVPEAK